MNFTASEYFDLSSFAWKDVFSAVNPAWESLSHLEDYISDLFKKGIVKANYKDADNVFLGEGTQVEEGAKIIGPLVTGKNCLIGHVSFLRGACLFGDNVHIGHAAEVKHSILLNGASAAHLNYMGNSIIGNRVNIAGGAMIANFRLDKQKVSVRVGDTKIQTGLEKFGAIIGDGSNIGAGAILNPGTILGKKTTVFPLISVTGVYHENEVIKK